MAAAAVTGKSMTATVTTVSSKTATSGGTTVTFKSAASGKTTVKTAAGVAASRESPIDRAAVNVAAIHITTIYIPPGIAGIAKSGAEACPIKPSAVKISGIGPFKEGPIVGVVIVVTVVTVPGRVVIIGIAREFVLEIYARCHDWSWSIFILVNWCWCRFCIDLGLAAGSDQTGGYYCGECKERFHDSRVFKLGDIVLLYKKAAEVITYI
jgi:hypothetical protein